jgi:hypothetical protein
MSTLAKLCASKLEQHVDRVFELERVKAMMADEDVAAAPYTGDPVPIFCETLFPHIKRTIIAALRARELFDRQRPSWAPRLPLASADIDVLLGDKDPRINLIGYFAASQACSNWSRSHPPFFVYAAGVMACEHTPEHIRTDSRLLKEFRPTLLAELDQTLCWNTDERIIEFTQHLGHRAQHFCRCGLLADAERMEETIKQLAGINETVIPDGRSP